MLVGGIDNIIKGWSKYLKGETDLSALARAEICRECPSAVLGTYEQLMPDFKLKSVKGLKCQECGCPLSTKLRSINEKCDLDKWERTK